MPEHVREHIDLIQPTVHFSHRVSQPDRIQKRSLGQFGKLEAKIHGGPKTNGKQVTITPTLEHCDEVITLDCLRALYSIDYTPVATDKNTFGIRKFHESILEPGTKWDVLCSGAHAASVLAE